MNKKLLGGEENTRLLWPDIAKGIGVIFVVLCHMGGTPWINSLHMPLFFILSGIMISIKDLYFGISMNQIIIKKLKSLIYPYFTFSIITIIFLITKNVLFRELTQVSIPIIIVETVTFIGLYALWFLPALFIAEIVSVFLLKKSKSVLTILVYIAISIIITHLFSVINYQQYSGTKYWILSLINVINRAVIGSIYVIIGYYLHKIYSHIKMKYYSLILFGSFLVSIAMYRFCHADMHYSKVGNPIIYYVCGISGGVFIILISKLLEKTFLSKVFSFCGKNSLIIFATHINLYVISIIKRLFHFNLEFFLDYFLTFALTMVVEVAIVIVINKLFPFITDFSKLRLFLNKKKEVI